MAKPGNIKKTDFQIHVLSEPTPFTPKGDEDLELVHAGLGKRLLTVPDNFKHSEVIANVTIILGIDGSFISVGKKKKTKTK